MKRYVMLEDKKIVDTKGDNNWKIYEDTLWHNSMLQGTIIKQSDNLIDLLEIGDCVEDSEGDIFSANNLFEKEMMKRWDNNKAIWKRNGDIMRRYEVI